MPPRPNPIAPGTAFDQLTVIGPAPSRPGSPRSQTRCACGTERVVRNSDLRSGGTLSCGCWKQERAKLQAAANVTHDQSRSPTYRCWADMRNRCLNPRVKAFRHYGARGIRVCERWGSFENFLADMGERPSGKTLDRIDNDGHYEPSNCRWADNVTQHRNKRTNHLVSFGGRLMCATEAAEQLGRHTSAPWKLAKKRGMTLQAAIDYLSARPRSGTQGAGVKPRSL